MRWLTQARITAGEANAQATLKAQRQRDGSHPGTWRATAN
jgi:hypothetical protein